MGVITEDENGTVVVRVSGEIDVASYGHLDDTLHTLAKRLPGRVVVDLSDVTFMDSSGLRTLVSARGRMDHAGRWLMIRGATGQPRRLLDIARVRYGITLMPEA